MATIRESQGTSNANNNITGSTFWASQTWTTTTGAYSVTGVRLWLSAAGGYTGNVTISLRATDGSDKPTGADLAAMTFDGSTLTASSSGDGITRNFDTPYELSASVIYAFVVRQTGLGIKYRRMAANPYAAGALYTSSDSGSTWGSPSSTDWKFEIYGDGLVPTKAENPSPTNNATEVDFSGLQISWSDGGNADTFDVYVGTTGNPTLVSSAQAGTTYTTTLTELTTIFGQSPIDQIIYWRVDATNAEGTTVGDEWNFDARPAKASVPSPTDSAADIVIGLTTTWTGGATASTYDTYADIGAGLALQSSALGSATWTPSPTIFDYITAYTWRVDSINDFGTTTGDEWSFTTIRLDPPSRTYFYPTTGQYYYLLVQSDGSLGDIPGVGVENTDFVYLAAGYEFNAIATTRKLVSAANSKIWYENI